MHLKNDMNVRNRYLNTCLELKKDSPFGGENTRVLLSMNPPEAIEGEDHEIQLSDKIIVSQLGQSAFNDDRENRIEHDNHLYHCPITNTTHPKSGVLPRKIAPHMRRLNIRFKSIGS
jgi:hypothetical protein